MTTTKVKIFSSQTFLLDGWTAANFPILTDFSSTESFHIERNLAEIEGKSQPFVGKRCQEQQWEMKLDWKKIYK